MLSLEALLEKPIPELKTLFIDRARGVPRGLVEALETDPAGSSTSCETHSGALAQ